MSIGAGWQATCSPQAYLFKPFALVSASSTSGLIWPLPELAEGNSGLIWPLPELAEGNSGLIWPLPEQGKINWVSH